MGRKVGKASAHAGARRVPLRAGAVPAQRRDWPVSAGHALFLPRKRPIRSPRISAARARQAGTRYRRAARPNNKKSQPSPQTPQKTNKKNKTKENGCFYTTYKIYARAIQYYIFTHKCMLHVSAFTRKRIHDKYKYMYKYTAQRTPS